MSRKLAFGFLTLALCMLFTGALTEVLAQNAVTFQVNMSIQMREAKFNKNTEFVTVAGTITLAPLSALKYTLTVNATFTEGAQSSPFTGTITVTLDKGTNLKDAKDDIYYAEGGVSGKTYSGTEYSVTISKKLKKFNDYKCIVEGIVTFTNKSATSTSTKTLDFGNGTKDKKATLTVGTVVKEIDL